MSTTYSQFAPTPFDTKGLNLPDRQEWLVAPVSITRDSGPLEESNFYTALESFGGESETVEVHRFGHWGPGWFEIILIHPSRQSEIDEMESTLADYPVLDEMDWSDREYTSACERWEQSRIQDRMEYCQRFNVSIFAARRDEIPDSPTGELIPYLAGSY